ncbi:uncharacterized protein JCM6883_003530 [Sporobolomyces salmoneus]|uniref:uncharacterized protein n=1 Tax=Sporobolomyces salmoneus TaxID=183962 RepID=UPI00316C9B28
MSKYASLPDIDVSGADVFETPDLPPQHSYSGDSDSEDEYLNRTTNSSPSTLRRQQAAKQAGGLLGAGENINQERLDAREARERFGRVERERTAREEKTQRRRRLPSTEEYVLEDERAKESPLERLRRLRSEVAELEDEVRKTPTPPAASTTTGESGEGQDGEKEKGKGKKREVSPAVILQQLQMLRGDLKGLEPTLENGVLEGTGEKEEGEFEAKAKASAGLLNKLGQAQATEGSTAQDADGTRAARNVNGEDKSNREGGELESRLAELEKILGANEADIDETNSHPVPLVPTLSRLDHLLTLLTQPRHLDSISRRVKVLTSDLERIHESRRKLGDTRPLNVALQGGIMTLSTTGGSTSGVITTTNTSTSTGASVTPDALQKIDSLFSLLPRLDPLLTLAPRLLTRLRSLQTLHQSSTSFSSNLNSLQTEVTGLGERKEGLEEILKTLEESFKGNQEKFEGNLKGLEERLEGLGKRLDNLQR